MLMSFSQTWESNSKKSFLNQDECFKLVNIHRLNFKPFLLPDNETGKRKTSLAEFRRQMRSGDLLANMSLSGPSNGIVLCSRCYFDQILLGNPISQKLNSRMTDGPTHCGTTSGHFKFLRHLIIHFFTSSGVSE